MYWASQVALVVKNLPANAGDIRDTGQSPGWEDPLEEYMETHSSILAWKILWTEESDRYGSQDHKESDMTEATQHVHMQACTMCQELS